MAGPTGPAAAVQSIGRRCRLCCRPKILPRCVLPGSDRLASCRDAPERATLQSPPAAGKFVARFSSWSPIERASEERVANREERVGCYSLFATCYSLFATCPSLFTTRDSIFAPLRYNHA